MTDNADQPSSSRRSRAAWWVYTAFGVIAAAVLAMGTLAICAVAFEWQGFWPEAGQPFATVIGGMAALAAGALALYNGERQRATEAVQWSAGQRRATAADLRIRFTTTITQLADNHPTSRRSGVYAIAALADDWHAFGNDTERQVCIDVLCGYLTTPNSTYVEPTADTAATAGEDGPVRATIVRLLATHRDSTEPASSWAGTEYAVTQADLRALKLVAEPLQAADLYGADLRHAVLCRAYLDRADLRGADLYGADLRHAVLCRAYLDRADLRGARLDDADLRGAHLNHVDLRGAHLDGAILGAAHLREADLSDAYLDRVNLSRADLSGANLSGAWISGIQYDPDTVWPEGFDPPD